jgi:2-polyprenyl-3-methyl-5-hydroxy-6-metoxy-1,4-benzoquinol methylase
MRLPTLRIDLAPRASGGVWVTCRRCDADDAVQVIRSDDRLLGIPGAFQVVRCRRCGFLYTNPQPGEAELTGHYPAGYYPEAPPAPGSAASRGWLRSRVRAGVLAARGYAAGPRPGLVFRAVGAAASRLLAQRFLWLPPFVPGGTLVDVGCATGAYLAELRELGWNVLGVEPSPDAAEAARGTALDVRTGTLEEAAMPGGSADVVVMRMVLEHVRDPRRTLAEARRILKPGGRLMVSVPNAGSLETQLFGRHWFAWDLPRHLSHFTPRSLTAMLREAGFQGVQVRHLVNANNLVQSLHYRRGGTGAPCEPTSSIRVLAALAAAARTAGRIVAEARLPDAVREVPER